MNNNYSYSLINYSDNISDYYVVFKLNTKNYAVNIKNVIEIINLPDIEISAKLPTCIIGTFNYKGMIIKAIDLCPLLGFNTENFSINDKLIIVYWEGSCFAIHTKDVTNIFQLNKSDIQPIPINNNTSIVKFMYTFESNIINILDIKSIDAETSKNNFSDTGINYSDLFSKDDKSQQILKLRNDLNLNCQNTFSHALDTHFENLYIVFSIDNNNYCIDLKYVKEFISIKRLNITKLPYCEDYVKGIINIKGDFLVVLDLKNFLNSDTTNIKEGSKLIIIEGQNFNIAFLVDEIKYIKNIKEVKPSILITEDNNKYIYSEFLENNEIFNILNMEKILNDEKIYVNIE